MPVAIVVAGLLLVLVAARCADFVNRILNPDVVAVAFSEGGDDAYYFFTVARNIAEGHGITVDQIHWTTGFQPLWGLLCSLAFLVAPDRGALAIIYVMSLGLWLAGAWLLVRFVRYASTVPLQPVTVALIVTLFLCEAQLAANYFNGMETGLYLTVCLCLLLAFQHHLSEPGPAPARRLIGIGLLAGLTMLARNDGLFLCAGLLAVTLVPGNRARPIREGAAIVLVAAVLVAPWLAYCQWASGNPMPQSGIATAASLRGHVGPEAVLAKVAVSLVPTLLVKVRTLIDDHLAIMLALAAAAAAGLAVYWLADRGSAVRQASRWVLAGLAIANGLILAYYPAFSAASQFFARYFTPLKLLVVILLSLLLVRAFDRLGRPLVAGAFAVVLAVAAVGSNLYWIARDFRLPFRGYIGDEAYAIMRSPYATGSSRLGLAESGRIGFLLPDRVVNLDGKMRVDALQALRRGTFAAFIQQADLDYIILQDHDAAFFDQRAPGWRASYKPVGELGIFKVFERLKPR